MEVPLEMVLPNPEQPREMFDAQELRNLAQSISQNGVIQPIVVEPAVNGQYILQDGERRLRAAKLAGLKTIPVALTAPLNGHGQQQRLVRALVANVQRADLSPIEEARSYQKLVEMGYSRNQIAIELGISSLRVSTRLDLLNLDQPIQDLIEEGKLSKDARLTKALLEIPDADARVKMAKTLSARNATIKASVEACDRLVCAMQAQTIPANEVPAIRLAMKRTGSMRRPIWDAMAQVGRVPPWSLMEICVRDTCDRCGLRDAASETTCRGCPLVDLLREMIGATK